MSKTQRMPADPGDADLAARGWVRAMNWTPNLPTYDAPGDREAALAYDPHERFAWLFVWRHKGGGHYTAACRTLAEALAVADAVLATLGG